MGCHIDREKCGTSDAGEDYGGFSLSETWDIAPSVRPADFTTKGRPGVRAQLLNVREGKLEMDFVVRPGQRSTHVLNAVSPAWTSSLAVAEYVVERIVV